MLFLLRLDVGGRSMLNIFLIQIPYNLDPPNEIERKCPLIVEKWGEWECTCENIRKINDEIHAAPLWQKIYGLLLSPFILPGNKKYYAELFQSRRVNYERYRDMFNKTIDSRRELYERLLAKDKSIEKQADKKLLGSLWNMFAFGEESYGGRFSTYFDQYWGEVENCLRNRSGK